METEKRTIVHEVLKSLCLDNGWSYGVFWSFDNQNTMLLTMEDDYCEDQMAGFIGNMLLQVHIIGNGIVGDVAYTKQHQWLFAENYMNPLSSTATHEISQDDSEIRAQFSSGIETIAIVSVEPHGVVQFGSIHKVLETIQFVDQTKKLFRNINKCDDLTLPWSMPSSSNGELNSINSLFLPSTTYSFSENINKINNASSYNYPGTSYSSTDIQNIYPFSLNVENQFKTTTTESPYFLSNEFIDFSSSFPSTPMQSSLTNTFNPESVIENDIFDNFGVNFEFGDIDNIFAGISMPVVNGAEFDFTKEVSECISAQHVSTFFSPRESLFSKLGIDQCLDGSFAGTSSDSKLSSGTKRKKEIYPDSQSCENSFVLQPKNSEESVKVLKKRAKPGSRPKPKDRQQIQDRIAELRKLIPNGIKMSIDSLLAQTIKHMVFLESVTKHAENLKKAEARKDKDYNGAWVFENRVQSMVDPVDVKDLSLPGQKQIQILCEEKGFFLEIVDTIQDIGLAILKGKMEAQDDKIWARFIVESEEKKYVTKQDIYLSLHQLLYQNGSSKVTVCDQLSNKSVNCGSNLFNNYHQNILKFPANFSNGLR